MIGYKNKEGAIIAIYLNCDTATPPIDCERIEGENLELTNPAQEVKVLTLADRIKKLEEVMK